MKSIIFTVIYLISCITIYSQVSKYSYAKLTSTWAYNSSPTNIFGMGAGINDAISSSIDIGFTFYYDQISYTHFKASTNGFITFNTANTLSQPTNNLKTSTERVIVAPLWDDNQTGAGGNVNYKLTGTTPNRVLTVEWKALRWNKSGFSAGTIDTQVKLYETTNIIEFVYNRGTYQSFGNSIGIGASIGMNGSVSGDFLSISDITGSPTISTTIETTTIGASPTNLTTMTQAAANTAIPNGTMFQMSPPPIALPIELVSFTGTVGNRLTWVTASERNNAYFTIERTNNGIDFEVIANINGAGNSQTMNEYYIVDDSYKLTINYYRLKQTDWDGKIMYSNLISIDNRQKLRILLYAVNLYGSIVDINTPGVVLLIYDDGTIRKIFNE
jgi:hypothetical protein